MRNSKTIGVVSRPRRALGAAAVAGLAGLTLGAGLAQAETRAESLADAPVATAGSAADSADSTELSGVKVDAQRKARPQSEKFTAPLLNTPRTVNIITSEAMAQQGISSLADAFRTVPGITLESGEGGAPAGDRPRIRGMDSTSDIFVDGIRDAGGQSREVFALEQVEIIKGPSSAVTGRGSTGGSVNLVTKTPRAEDFAAASVTLGTDQTRRASVDLNHVVNDLVAVRLNALYHENEVAGRDAVHGDRWGVAPSVVLGLGGPTQLNLDYYHLESSELPDYGLPYVRTTVGGVVYGSMLTGHDDDFYGLKSRDYRDTSADISTLRFQQAVGGDWKFSAAVRYGRTTNDYVVTNPDDSRGNVANGYVFRGSKNRNTLTTTKANANTLTGTLTTGAIKHSLALGTEWAEEFTHSQGYLLAGPGLTTGTIVSTAYSASNLGCSSASRLGATYGYNCTTLDNPNPNDPWIGTVRRSPAYTDTRVTTHALFAFDTIEFNPQWLLNLGVRYDEYVNRYSGVSYNSTTGVSTLIAPLRNEASFWNYQAGLIYKPSEASSLYVSYGTSSNPSGEGAGDGSSLAATTVNLDPEENETVEFGAKWDALGGRLALTAAAYRTDKTNARVTDAAGVIALVGNSRVQGVELSAGGQITSAWSVTAGYSYTDSEVIDGGFSSGVASTSNGKMFPNTPKHAITSWTAYRLTPSLTVGAGASYMSKRYANAANTYSVPEYWRYDAMVGWKVNDRLDLQLNLQNLSDERYAVKPYSTHMVQIAAGRTGLLTLNVKY